MPEARKLRIFLCHSSNDKPAVRELYQRLKGEGWIDPWLDEEKLYPGQDWDLEIEKAVEAADAVIVFLSNNSVSKEGYVQRELRFVLRLADFKPEGTVFVIPVRLDDCPMPRRLSMWQYVDYFPENRKDWAYQRLLGSLKVRARKLEISIINPAEEQDLREAEEKAKKEKEEREWKEREEKARKEKEAREKAETEERAYIAAAEKAKKEKEAREREEAEERARMPAEQKVKKDRENQNLGEAVEKVRNEKDESKKNDSAIDQIVNRSALHPVIKSTDQNSNHRSLKSKIALNPIFKTKWFPIGIGGLTLLSIGCFIIGIFILRDLFTPVGNTPTKPAQISTSTGIQLTNNPLDASQSTPDSTILSPLAITTQPSGDSISPTSTFLPKPTLLSQIKPKISEKDSMVMVYIPAGEFQMGSDDGESDEKPIHTVNLDAFWIDQTEVTNGMYAQCEDSGDCTSPYSDESENRDNYYRNPEYDRFPVGSVTWDDADSYCKWAGRRLPSEAEWEKGARGGLERKEYPWGNEKPVFEEGVENGANFCDGGAGACNRDTEMVGSFFPNGFGAYDMAGNLWEWVADWYDVYPDGILEDYTSRHRLLRGGSYAFGNLRVADRHWYNSSATDYFIGFRCAMYASE